MSEFEVKAHVEHKDAPAGWPIVIYYEVDRNHIDVNGVYEDHVDADTDYLPMLSKEQLSDVLMICQDDYNYRCDMESGAYEDYMDGVAQDRKLEARHASV